MNPTPEDQALNRELIGQIIDSDPAALKNASDAGVRYIRRRLREGDHAELQRWLARASPEDSARALAIGRRFAALLLEDIGRKNLRQVDELNRDELREGVCHSHDFCDANVVMDDAFCDVTGTRPSDKLPVTDPLWERAWDYAKFAGFVRLACVKGVPDEPLETIRTSITMNDGAALKAHIRIPGAPPVEMLPDNLPTIDLDYWGRSPKLQILVYGQNEDEVTVHVRFNDEGKVVEVMLGDPDILVVADHSSKVRVREGGHTTNWEQERDANPPCHAGDLLQCPSGLVGVVMRLRDRYDNDIEQLRSNDETYGILERLGKGVYNSVEQAWDINPLTVGTAEPSDFSFVPEFPKRLTEEPAGDTRYTLFLQEEPVATESEEGQPPKWLTFATEREAQLEIIGDAEEYIRQFKAGERDFDIWPEFYVRKVRLLDDGTLVTEDAEFPPPTPSNEVPA
jgi:hypothetical protein